MELMDKLVGLCKRRGFVFQNSEPYSGLSGFFDYGPLGVELNRNIEKFWWDYMVRLRENVVGLDSACIGPEAVWVASGHVGAFNDVLVDDKNSKERFRIDQLKYQAEDDAEKAEIFALNWIAAGGGDETHFWDGLKEHIGYYPLNPNSGKASRFTIPRQFNLMFRQQIGATGEAAQTGYLRAETCQPIFVDFELVRVGSRQQVPFGIAQVGKAFRNEINPRNFLFRCREFSQMELEFFVRPDELVEKLKAAGVAAEDGADGQPGTQASTMDWYDYWLAQRKAYYAELGLPEDKLRIVPHPPEKLAHYARAACDVYFEFPHGWGELEGIHHRGDYDLKQHQQHSGKSFTYFDMDAEQALIASGMDKAEARAAATYLPVCIETSVGLGRTFLAVLSAAYAEDTQETKHEGKDEDIRIVLRLHPRLAPVKAAVLPLSKKLGGPGSEAYRLYRELLRAGLNCEYDDAGSIGKRYRRQDEIGTPWCICYDFESTGEKGDELKDTVTIRDRDTLEQVRVPISEVAAWIQKRLN
ncbi:glycine--tRNA ligase [bacterium]|nr:glycine--tRNA ligase [bacterium]